MPTETIDLGGLIRQIPTQYPFVLVDRVLAHDAVSLRAVKNVTGSEEFLEGHFPGSPVMPGVLLLESLAQAAGIWLLKSAPDPSRVEVHVVGIDEAKFRRPVIPGDQLLLTVRVLHRRGSLCRVLGEITSGEHRVAEARLLLQVEELEAGTGPSPFPRRGDPHRVGKEDRERREARLRARACRRLP